MSKQQLVLDLTSIIQSLKILGRMKGPIAHIVTSIDIPLKCYKIHEYPSSYKSRLRDNFQNSSGPNSVNQLSTSFTPHYEDT